ncbi:MAG: hypothetical protein RMJ00_00500 [Nitrososphaerota archaeon]|nr:hypothetical protein [Candidatus Bathyarchaeota archaeon]MDW8061171.1 hypothetical protein [Nitrososphaerota archaeon]
MPMRSRVKPSDAIRMDMKYGVNSLLIATTKYNPPKLIRSMPIPRIGSLASSTRRSAILRIDSTAPNITSVDGTTIFSVPGRWKVMNSEIPRVSSAKPAIDIYVSFAVAILYRGL